MYVYGCSGALYIHMWVPGCLCVCVTIYILHVCVHMYMHSACMCEWVPVCIEGKCWLISSRSSIYPVSA